MVTRSPGKYVVDEKGQKKAILLDIKDYSRLLSRLEELEDALALDEAVRKQQGFRPYQAVREELQKEGRL